MGPEVVGRALYHQHGLVGIGGLQHSVSLPGVDLAVGEHDAGGLNVGSAVDGQSVLDLVGHLCGGEAEGLGADVQVHLYFVQTLE